MGKFIKMAAIAVIAALSFTACSDDDDESLADIAKGSYDVTMTVSFGESTLPLEDQALLLTKVSDKKVNFSVTVSIDPIYELPLTNIPVEVTNVTLGGSDNNITIKHTGTISLPSSLVDGEEGKTDVDVEITGTIKDRAYIDIYIKIKGTIVGDLTIRVIGDNE